MFITHWSISDIDDDPCITLKTTSVPHEISKSINLVSVLKNTLVSQVTKSGIQAITMYS